MSKAFHSRTSMTSSGDSGGASARSRAYFDIQVGDAMRGRIVFELYTDLLPRTCANFIALCTNPRPPQYKRSLLFRIIPGFLIQGGDFEQNNGRGGHSVYGGCFEDESFDGLASNHDTYALIMCNAGSRNTNGSQFAILLRPQPQLAGRHVCFGRVIEGQDVVRDIENQGTPKTGYATQRVMVANCGML